jgi:hypothetical protein
MVWEEKEISPTPLGNQIFIPIYNSKYEQNGKTLTFYNSKTKNDRA